MYNHQSLPENIKLWRDKVKRLVGNCKVINILYKFKVKWLYN